MYTKDLLTKLKSKFLNIENIERNYSQAYQDMFALYVNKGKKNGTNVDIGSHTPVYINNTFLLESVFDWTGISFEIDTQCVREFNKQRKNKCIECDATTFLYKQCFDELKLPKRIDYLSVDIEPASKTLKALKQIPFNEYRFNAITFEHDTYRWGNSVQQESRSFLNDQGYTLAISDVSHLGNSFEDWYIDTTVITDFPIVNNTHHNISELFLN